MTRIRLRLVCLFAELLGLKTRMVFEGARISE